MAHDTNHLGQPVGLAVPDWQPPPRPAREIFEGRYCKAEPLDLDKHAASLYAAYSVDVEGGMWTYLSYGPFDSLARYRAWLETHCLGDDPLSYAIIDRATESPVGVASYVHIDPAAGSIEVGHLAYSPLLQRKPAATEAMYLMMKRAFELGYRRYEWKANALNARSRRAAQRLGLSFEGVFRQAAVHKGRNRDSAWYAAIDSEWPALEEAFRRWLAPENFDAQGRQKIRLSQLTAPILKQRG